jgi:2-octaprenyl-6-methoxyphenol hydroxylase
MMEKTDIAIVGGGLNGLAAAVALGGNKARRPVKVAVIDAQSAPATGAAADWRASAITATSRAMFEAIGVWEAIAPHAEAMREIAVTDSKSPGAARPALLHFQDEAGTHAPSAYLVENQHLLAALLGAAMASPNITICWGCAAARYEFGRGLVTLETLEEGGLQCSLLVAADGRNSRARREAGIETVGWTYGQTGIIATVAHEHPHHGRAEEHFLPPGPFAILPLPGNRSSIVWTERDQEAQRIMGLDDEGFLAELRPRFGTHLGDIRLDSPRQAYPLAMYLARRFVGHRLALIGDAAHVVHPIAGLGFNLGLRDVAALAECVAQADSLGLDIGGAATLGDYERWRRFDTVATALATDGLNRLFANDLRALRLIRDAGLMAVNVMRPLKGFFMREAAGQTGKLPKLMRGEAV